MALLKKVEDREGRIVGITENGEEVYLSNPVPDAGVRDMRTGAEEPSIESLEKFARLQQETAYYQIPNALSARVIGQAVAYPYIIWKGTPLE